MALFLNIFLPLLATVSIVTSLRTLLNERQMAVKQDILPRWSGGSGGRRGHCKPGEPENHGHDQNARAGYSGPRADYVASVWAQFRMLLARVDCFSTENDLEAGSRAAAKAYRGYGRTPSRAKALDEVEVTMRAWMKARWETFDIPKQTGKHRDFRSTQLYFMFVAEHYYEEKECSRNAAVAHENLAAEVAKVVPLATQGVDGNPPSYEQATETFHFRDKEFLGHAQAALEREQRLRQHWLDHLASSNWARTCQQYRIPWQSDEGTQPEPQVPCVPVPDAPRLLPPSRSRRAVSTAGGVLNDRRLPSYLQLL